MGRGPAAVPPTSTVTVVLTGVSGVGKSSVAAEVVSATGWAFVEGDALHSRPNRARMAAGQPLGDTHRAPWLRALAAWIGQQEGAGRNAVLTCSALRRSYRDTLRTGHPSVWFVHLTVSPSELERRLVARTGHFMPASLLASQLATLEPLQSDEPGVVVPAERGPRQLAEEILRLLPGRS